MKIPQLANVIIDFISSSELFAFGEFKAEKSRGRQQQTHSITIKNLKLNLSLLIIQERANVNFFDFLRQKVGEKLFNSLRYSKISRKFHTTAEVTPTDYRIPQFFASSFHFIIRFSLAAHSSPLAPHRIRVRGKQRILCKYNFIFCLAAQLFIPAAERYKYCARMYA